LNIFICGPTLYEKCHMGHARIFIFFNFLINFHRFLGNSPIAILQLTDIDHKIFQKVSNNAQGNIDISEKFLGYLLEDLKNIQIDNNFIYTRVSDFLSLIKNDVIKVLKLKKGYSYAGNVYLKITKDIFSLLGLTLEDIENMPIDISWGKHDQRDIMIWNSENFYQGYLKKNDGIEVSHGRILTSGIPGWHFQDWEIIKNVFNGEYDIHGGASELLYPHHEFIYEISKNIYNNYKTPPINSWIHIGLVNINSKKMSNSSGNTISISEILERYNANTLKIFFLSKNYRKDIEFSNKDLDESEEIDKVITNSLLTSKNNLKTNNYSETTAIKQFLNLLYNDYDTVSALNLILDNLDEYQNPELIKRMLEILGLKYY
jgi:cysteinyl-tRNA synthetase